MKKVVFFFLVVFSSSISCTVVDTELPEPVLEIKNQNEELKKQNDTLLGELKTVQSKTDSLVNALSKSTAKQEELLKKPEFGLC